MKRLLIWLPLALFAGLFAVVAAGLVHPADRTVRSALVGQSLPDFALPPMVPGKPGLASADVRGGSARVVNVFASWCVPCAAEAPQLARLKALGVPVDAIATRDTATGIAGFLKRYGDPFDRIGDDRDGRVQLALGSSGVPESYVVDGNGKILLQHVGEIRAEDVAEIVRAAAAGARAQ
ncbi:MAG: redoxin family protein [Sphingomonas sp.]|jgi:cytochrome c biogenesis protein CcmG/thiol:disulfide interchange protein DsbE